MAVATVRVAEVRALRTKSGNTRFVLRDEDGNEYTTFKEAIARDAITAEGRRARIEFHEQQREGFTNVYLDKVELLDEPAEPSDAAGEADEVAWKTAIDAAPWLLGKAPPGGVEADELFDRLQPFKELVADDIRDGEDADDEHPNGDADSAP
jgi:hypothetical protein